VTVLPALAGAVAALVLALRRTPGGAVAPIAFWAGIFLVILGVPGLVLASSLGPVAGVVIAIAVPSAALSWAVALGGGGQGPTATS